MQEFHKEAPWYSKEVQQGWDEEQEAAEMLAQAVDDPSVFSKQARRQDTVLLQAFGPDSREVKAEDLEGIPEEAISAIAEPGEESAYPESIPAKRQKLE